MKAIFLDRDGTLVKDVHYCSRPEDLEFLPTVIDGLKLLNDIDFKVIVITNQSGIARGYFTECTLNNIHEKMKADLLEQNIKIDAIYYCPHHPNDKCQCRKPNIGLFAKAASEWNLELSQSYFIGDKYLDAEAANKAGCKVILVPSSEPELGRLNGKDGFKGRIDLTCADFVTAVRWIMADTQKTTNVSVLIPTLNEAKNLIYVLPKISQEFEVILVDGHSTDDTLEEAKKLRPNIKIITQNGRGKGNAIKCGAEVAKGNYFLVLDADGSQRPEEIPLYEKKASEGYDLIKGSRYMKGANTNDETWIRKIIIRTAQGIANKLWRTKYSDICYGMFMVNRQKFCNLNIQSEGFDIEWELMAKSARKRFKITEVPAIEDERINGKSHLSIWHDGRVIAKAVFKQYINSFRENNK
jgi:D,D-heptose 1,7-bisphosphate phosphatase